MLFSYLMKNHLADMCAGARGAETNKYQKIIERINQKFCKKNTLVSCLTDMWAAERTNQKVCLKKFEIYLSIRLTDMCAGTRRLRPVWRWRWWRRGRGRATMRWRQARWCSGTKVFVLIYGESLGCYWLETCHKCKYRVKFYERLRWIGVTPWSSCAPFPF